MNKTLKQKIQEIKKLSTEKLGDLLSIDYRATSTIEDCAHRNGRIETAKEAILIIDELLQQNKRLEQEIELFRKLTNKYL